MTYAPLGTLVAAVFAVLVASLSLRASRQSATASRRSAENSAASVEKADAALRGSVRPILDAEVDHHGLHLVVSNVGPGVALDVRAIMASVVVGAGGWPLYDGWFDEPTGLPVVAPGGGGAMRLRGWDSETSRSPLMVLLTCRDVNGEAHYIHRVVGHSPLSGRTTLDVGRDYPAEVQRFLDEYSTAKEKRQATRQAAHEERQAETQGA